MKFLKIILLYLLLIQLNTIAYGQENTAMPERSPEQEAVKQTDKLRSELQLSNDQLKRVHEINLKYARERQSSNTRSDALQRIKEKDEDLQRVLNAEQYNRLQHKRYDRSSFQSASDNSTKFESPTDSRVNSGYRTSTSTTNRNSENSNYRVTSPSTYQRRAVQSSTDKSSDSRNYPPRTSPSTGVRSSSSSGRSTYTAPSTRSSTVITEPTQRSSRNNESSRSSSSSSSSRTESTSGSNRR